MNKVKLCDIFDLQMGKTPARNNSSLWNGKNKWISIADLGNSQKFISKTKETISDEGVKNSGIKVVPKNTVIMSFKLSIGKTAITTENMYTNEAIMAFIDKKKYPININYIYHLFSNFNWALNTNKAVMGLVLNKAKLSQIKVPIPSIKEQNYIANVLDKVDKLIILQRNQLKKLDLLVKSRFIELFGDPVQNPKNWEIRRYEDISLIITDGEHSTPKRVSEKGIYLLSARNILNHSLQLDDVDFIDEIEYNRIAKRIVPKEKDLLISCSGSIGRICVVPKNLKFQMVRSVALLRLKHFINPIYMEYLFTTKYTKNQIKKLATMSSQANLFQGKIKKLTAIIPPIEIQNDFADFVQQINKSKVEIQKSLDKLEILKKSLMQQYFG